MFNKTKIYNVYVQKNAGNAMEQALFVRDGFSVWAFIFEAFYFIYRRMWFVVIALFLLYAAKFYLLNHGFISVTQSDVATIAVKFFLAFEASNFRAKQLERKGYILIDIVTAHDEMEAQKRFYDKYAFAQNSSQNNTHGANFKTA